MEQPTGVKAWRQEEYGLRLPDGTEVWPPERWHGHGFATSAEREAVFKAVLASEEHLALSTHEVVDRFQWLQRCSTITVVVDAPHCVTSLEQTGWVEPASEPDVVQVDPETNGVWQPAMEVEGS